MSRLLNTVQQKKGGITMKRIFYETRLYDYTSYTEAEQHIREMNQKGWNVKRENNVAIRTNGTDTYKYSVEFYRHR